MNLNDRYFRIILSAVFLSLLAIPFNNCSSPKAENSAGSSGSSGGSPGGGGGGSCTTAACGNPVATFNTVVKPAFENRCRSCHNFIFQGGTAPVTIFDYDPAKAHLASGTSSSNNRLINKALGLASHGGGNICTAGIAQTPCREILQWWETEYGRDASGQNIGQVTSITEMGVVNGWAVNAQNTAATMDVFISGDGPDGVGTPLTVPALQANLAGNSGYPGNHMFQFQLPAAFRNGQPHQLFVYVVVGGRKYSLQGSPASYTAFTPTAAGMAYYNATVAPALTTNCGGCHSFAYNVLYAYLLSPLPSAGGTATNNFLINKMGGPATHSGGNRCNGSKANAPCSLVAEWYRREFP
jgi:hypothetical protein